MDELCSIDPTIFQSQWSAEEYIPQSMILRKHQDKSCRQDSRSSAANEVNTNSRRSEDLSFVSVPNTPKSTSDIKSQLNIQTGSEGDVVTSDSNPSSNIHDPPHLKPFNIIQYLKEPYSQGTQGTSFHHQERNPIYASNDSISKPKEFIDTLFFLDTNQRMTTFVIDSGATQTVVPDHQDLSNENSNNTSFAVASGDTIKASTIGTLTFNKAKFKAYKIQDLSKPLLSVKQLTDQGIAVIFTKESVYAFRMDQDITNKGIYAEKIGEHKFNNYILSDNPFKFLPSTMTPIAETLMNELNIMTSVPSDLFPQNVRDLPPDEHEAMKLHISLGHLSYTQMYKQQLIPHTLKHLIQSCPTCIVTKNVRSAINKKPHAPHSKKPHHRMAVDLYYSSQLYAKDELDNGKFYVTIAVDEYSGYIHAFTTNNKSAEDVSENINIIIDHYNVFFGHKLLELKTDKGNEFTDINPKLLSSPIQYAPTGDKEANGLAERNVALHKIQRQLVCAHVPAPLEAITFSYSVLHASTLLNFRHFKDFKDNPYNLYHTTDKKLPKMPMYLEDVVVKAMKNNQEITLIGSFLYYHPRLHKFFVIVYDSDNLHTYYVAQFSPQYVTRTYKLYFAKFVISKETWNKHSIHWGPQPNDWYNTYVDLLHNTTHTVTHSTPHLKSFLPLDTNDQKSGSDFIGSTQDIDDKNVTRCDVPLDPAKDLDPLEPSDSPHWPRESMANPLTNTKEYLNIVDQIVKLNNDDDLNELLLAAYDTEEHVAHIVQQTDGYYGNTEKPPKKVTNNMTGPWHAATQKEKTKFIDMKVFQPCFTLPTKPIYLREIWVHVTKATGPKSRMVIFNPKMVKIKTLMNSAPVVSSQSFHTMLHLAGIQNLQLKLFDIDNAFLYGDLPENNYILRTPAIFRDVFKSPYLVLKKAAYGLAESPRVFYDHISDVFVNKMNFTRSENDNCLFYKGTELILVVHVDDGAIAGTPEMLKEFFDELPKHFKFKMNDSTYLGLDIEVLDTRDRTSNILVPYQPKDTSAATPTSPIPNPVDTPVDTPFYSYLGNPQNYQPTPKEVKPEPETTTGYGKFETIKFGNPKNPKSHTSYQIPKLEGKDIPVYTIAADKHIKKFLSKYIDDNPHYIPFLKSARLNYDDVLKQLAFPKHESISKFMTVKDPILGIPPNWLETFKDATKNRSLLGALAYITFKVLPQHQFAVIVLSRYNNYHDRTVSYLLHCIVRDLFSYTGKIVFYRPEIPRNYVNLFCYSDASLDPTGRYYKGGLITLDGSPLYYKTATGNETKRSQSTAETEVEAASQLFTKGSHIRRLLLEMGIKVNFFCYIDNLAVLRSVYNNNNAEFDKKLKVLFELREAIKNRVVDFGHIRGNENAADIFTKPYTKANLAKWINFESSKGFVITDVKETHRELLP